jgi:hypothetical protein
MRFTAAEEEFPLPSPLRGYTLVSRDDTDPWDLSIVPSASKSKVYAVSIVPVTDTRHLNSITMCSTSHHNAIVGAARMANGSDIVNLAMGDPEGADDNESCAWEQMRIKQTDLHNARYGFGLGLGDDQRRNFEWWPVEIDRHLTWGSVISSISKFLRKERVSSAQRRCFKLIDRDAGETVAIVMRHTALLNSEIIDSDDIGELGTRGRFLIFRDFWESGRHEDSWDQMILLTGLAVLEMSDRE